jgi:hypothetical protein
MTPTLLFQYVALALGGLAVGLVLVGLALCLVWLLLLFVKGLLREPTAEELAQQRIKAQAKAARRRRFAWFGARK